MEGPGRKSVAALSVVTPLPGQRPEPPEFLTEAEASAWRVIVSTKPHDWFNADTVPLLIEYCRASVAAGQFATELAAFKKIPAKGERFRRYVALRKMQDTNTRQLAMLATKMRLTPQSRYTPQSATTADKRGGSGSKPWEFGKTG